VEHLAIVGAGSVGTAIAFASLVRGQAQRISLYDLNHAKATSEVLDLRHGLEFVPPAIIDGGDDIGICSGADVIVITAGAKQRQGESRLDLAGRNAELLRALLPGLTVSAPDAVLLVITNPVDVLTQLAVEMTGRDDGSVLGSGTVLDSSRLRHLLALRYGIAERHVHAHVVGEHGDSETVLWSSARIGGAPLEQVVTREGRVLGQSDREEILDQVRSAAYEIIAGKGATSWAIALATCQILEALDLTSHSAVLPVTAPLDPGLGLGDAAISLPRLVDAAGAGAVLPFSATPGELDSIRISAAEVEKTLAAVT
jgi:L-lactate dehydrogenase